MFAKKEDNGRHWEMGSKFLIWLDIMGFEELGKTIAQSSRIGERKVREDFIRLLSEKIEQEEKNGDIIGKKYGEADDWLLVADSLDSVFKVICEALDHNTEYKGYEKIPLEIVIGKAQYDEWAKLDGSNLVSEDTTIHFLKSSITDYYRKWYKLKYSRSPTSSFIALTEAVYEEMNPFDKEFCEKVEYTNASTEGKEPKICFFIAQVQKVVQRGMVFRFLKKIGKSPTSSFRRIERIFVPPNEYQRIIDLLEKQKLVFMVGDPEIGKTYTAARIMWEYYLKGYDPVWHSGAEPQERASIRKKISECEVMDNTVTYFEDPFGRIKFEDREDLRRTIDCVVSKIQNLDARVIITSREEVFKEFEKEKLSPSNLRELTIEMRLMKPSYGDEKMEQMLLQWATEFDCEWLKSEKLKTDILFVAKTKLTTPLSIWDFALTSRKDVDVAKIKNTINEKSMAVKSAFAEEILQMPKEKQLFLSLVLVLNPLTPETIKPVYDRISEELNVNTHSSSFEISENQFSEKINLEERDGIEGNKLYFRFTHPSYEEAIIASWRKPDIHGLVLKFLNALVTDNQPEVRGCCGLCLIRNLSEISFKSEAKKLINKVFHDKKTQARYGIAEGIENFFLDMPLDDRMDYLKLLLDDRHREIRAVSIRIVNSDFAYIPLKESLDIIEKGLEDQAATVRLDTVRCVRSHMDAIPDHLVHRALRISKELCHYSGWLIGYFASIEFGIFQRRANEHFIRKQRSHG
jgi:hypothetical protein